MEVGLSGFNNDFGDDQASPKLEYGVEEKGSSDYNEYMNNYVAGIVKTEYYGLGLHSRIIDMDCEDMNDTAEYYGNEKNLDKLEY